MKKYLILSLILFSAFVYPQQLPEWAKGIVWYQIFPERFANGDAANEPAPDKVFTGRKAPEGWAISKWTGNWFESSGWEKNAGGKVRNHLFQRRYGGDLQGIIDHLDYLKELGVGAIYLNPIFESVSLHKYDATMYHHIDINFGPDPEGDKKIMETENPADSKTWKWTSADKLFLKLIEEVHKRGMRIVIDGVFNHVGDHFWAFEDVVKNQQNSKYKDWFMIKSFDDPATEENEFDYTGWWGNKGMPQFNRTDSNLTAEPKQYIFDITSKWMDPNGDGNPSDGIDGWRLDVAREVPLGFWKDWSRHALSLNDKAVIIGELWEFSPDFISETGPFSSLMNYNFAYAVQHFFINNKKAVTVTGFVDELKKILNTYPSKNLDLLQNLMDSHDTERLSTMIANPDRDYDRDANEDNKSFNPGKPSAKNYNTQRLIAAFQMTFKGSPMIYYGDEVGMWGADDPHDRKPMVWNNMQYDDEVIDTSSGFSRGYGTYKVKQNKDMLDFYKKVIAIRNENPALQKGSIDFIYTNNGNKTFAFERKEGSNKIITVFNLSGGSTVLTLKMDGEKIFYEELLNGEEGNIVNDNTPELNITIPSRSVKIYRIYSNEK